MKISKLKIKNLFGITEFEADEKSIELMGANGTGKTSVLDSIRLALTNKTDRDFTVKNGECEGEIYIEFDNGISITRKPRTNKTDYKKITKDGKEIQKPEEFLSSMFSKLQLDPVEFIELDTKEQNRVLLELIHFDWDLQTIENWFGEIPTGVDYSKPILEVLAQIASEEGFYYKQRRMLNSDIKNKEAIVEEMVRSIPEGFNAQKWNEYDLTDAYSRLEKARQYNSKVDKAVDLKNNYDIKIAGFVSQKAAQINVIKQEILDEKNAQTTKIAALEAELTAAKERLGKIGENEAAKIEVAEATYNSNVSKFNEELKAFQPYLNVEKMNTKDIQDEIDTANSMKIHLSEHERMLKINEEIDKLKAKASELTAKIELARTLPADILKGSDCPLKNMSIDGTDVLINGLPVSNLSEGEKLNLCVDIAMQNKKGLQIVLLDGVEKLSTVNRYALFDRCRKAGVQFIATRTTDDSELTVVEL